MIQDYPTWWQRMRQWIESCMPWVGRREELSRQADIRHGTVNELHVRSLEADKLRMKLVVMRRELYERDRVDPDVPGDIQRGADDIHAGDGPA